MANGAEYRADGATMSGNRYVWLGRSQPRSESTSGRVMRTITLSMVDIIQGCFGSGIYLLIGLPNIRLPQLVLFCERRNNIKVATKGALNIRFGLTLVTSVYTHNLTES